MIGVAVGTYGDDSVWAPLAKRAIVSVQNQALQCEYKWVHEETLHEARNEAAYVLIRKGCDWLIFLDADDELSEDYAVQMNWIAQRSALLWPIFRPATLDIVDGVEPEHPYFSPEYPLIQRNFVNIGAMHKAEMFEQLGGFKDWPVLEDWAYWLDACNHGAEIVGVPSAVYRIHEDTSRPRRNFGDSTRHNAVAASIRQMYRREA